MLAQFQARYPTGSLISELLQIYQGKFVVRVSATVEGITRATGMAAAETLELAEDRARSRALAVLGIQPPLSTRTESGTSETATSEMQLQPGLTASSGLTISSFLPPSAQEESTPAPAVSPGLKQKSNRHRSTPTPSAQAPDAAEEKLGIMSSPASPASPALFVASPALGSLQQNGTRNELGMGERDEEELIPPRESGGRINLPPASSSSSGASEPVDLSDAIARTSVELRRLRWTTQHGREYLERTYGKRSRQQLTDDEMLEFLNYLESQPSPPEESGIRG